MLDAGTRKGAEFATVSLIAGRNDSLITGTLVRGNGDFVLEKIVPGTYMLRFSFIGYVDQEKMVTITREDPRVDIGNILLEPNSELLKEVEVISDRSAMIMKVDRRVYNVERDLSARGGNAEDVMRNIPGLSVDLDGNVQLRNASPQLLIDGRPTTMTLDQIPAEEIDRVEVITNPSVAFDANTTGGLINVVLKKNDKPGYSGRLESSVGTNDRYRFGGNVQVQEGRTNVNLSYNYNTARNSTMGYTDRTDLFEGTPISYFDQESTNRNKREGHGGRLSVDWKLNNRNTLTVSQSVRTRGHNSSELQDFSVRTLSPASLTTGTQNNTHTSEGTDLTSQIGFKRVGPKDGKEFTADITYNRGRRENNSTFLSTAYDQNGVLDPSSTSDQLNVGTTNTDRITFQSDMVVPQGDRDKLEFGVKFSLTDRPSTSLVYDRDPDSGMEVLDSALSNELGITDNIHAAYGNWTHKFTDHWSMQAGLRLEITRFTGEILGTGGSFSYEYPKDGKDLDKALFPAVYLVRRWDDEGGRELQFNVSRKIQRPNFWQINPFISFRDNRNFRVGNPTLAPEISTMGEVSHLLPIGKGRSNWLSTVFTRYTDDVITGYTTPSTEDSTLLISSYINARDSWTAGWENTVRIVTAKRMEITVSGTAQYTDLSTGIANARNAGWSGEVKGMFLIRLPKDLAFQVNGEYEFPTIQAQGRSLANYTMDVSLSKDIGKRWSVVASVRDVFNQRRWGSITETETFISENSRRWEQRNGTVTLAWRFGERDASLFNRRKQGRTEPGLQDDGEGQ